VTSKKDQAQYWADPSKPYAFVSVAEIAKAFKNSKFGRYVESLQSHPYDKSKGHPSALARTKYAVPRWDIAKACFARELLLMKRHSFLYIFRTCQVRLKILSFLYWCSLVIENHTWYTWNLNTKYHIFF